MNMCGLSWLKWLVKIIYYKPGSHFDSLLIFLCFIKIFKGLWMENIIPMVYRCIMLWIIWFQRLLIIIIMLAGFFSTTYVLKMMSEISCPTVFTETNTWPKVHASPVLTCRTRVGHCPRIRMWWLYSWRHTPWEPFPQWWLLLGKGSCNA